MAARYPYTVSVLRGLNQGAEASTGEGRGSVGSAEDADIRLDGCADSAFVYRLTGDRIALKAVSGEIRIDDERSCAIDQIIERPLPARIATDDGTVVLFYRTGGAATPRRRLPLTLFATVATIAAVFVFLWPQIQVQAPTPADASTQSANVVAEIIPVVAPVDDICTDCVAEARTYLEERLDAAGFTQLSVVQKDGSLRLTGIAAPDGREALQALKEIYDQKWDGLVPLHASPDFREAEAPISVGMIWTGASPEVVTRDGKRLRTGDPAGEGWTVMAILETGVELSRGSELLFISTEN